MPEPTEQKSKESKSKTRKFIQFSGMAIEMGGLIFVGAWLGKQADTWLEFEKPFFLLTGTLLFTLAAIYRVIRDLG